MPVFLLRLVPFGHLGFFDFVLVLVLVFDLEDDEDLLNEDGFYIRFGHLLNFIRTQLIFKIKNTNVPIVQINNNTKDK